MSGGSETILILHVSTSSDLSQAGSESKMLPPLTPGPLSLNRSQIVGHSPSHPGFGSRRKGREQGGVVQRTEGTVYLSLFPCPDVDLNGNPKNDLIHLNRSEKH